MTTRARVRVGRPATYFPTDAEASAGGGESGDSWPAFITDVNAQTGAVNLFVFEADGGAIAKTDVELGTIQGSYTVHNGGLVASVGA